MLLMEISKKIFTAAAASAIFWGSGLSMASGELSAASITATGTPATLTVSASLPALPVTAGVTQKLEISLPGGAPDGEFDAEVEAKSGWGVVLFPSGPAASGRAKISRSSPLRLEYRWAGATPVNASAAETVAVSVPKLGASGEIKFQVGVDLRIREISIAGAQAGIFNPVEIFVEDAFNPSLDAPALLEKIGGAVEISMSLSGGPHGARLPARDPVLRAFFGETESDGGTSYPGKNFEPGTLARDGGRFVWRGKRAAGITPPAPGAYTMEAVLKANLGGAPLKGWTSPPFEARDGKPRGAQTSSLIGSALGVIAGMDADVSSQAEAKISELIESGDARGAMTALGNFLSRSFGGERVALLGKFSSALAESGRSDDEIINFLTSAIGGFGDCGVLIFTRPGASEWSAPGAATYDNSRFVAIPFAQGKNITVRLTGSPSGDVSVWKIIPSGVNVKKYPKGPWVKEITVYTSEVAPPVAR